MRAGFGGQAASCYSSRLILERPIRDTQPLGRSWLALLAILVVGVPGLLLGIDHRLTTHTMENLAIVTSQETFLRQAAGDHSAWLVTTNDGMPRLEKPPMATWLNLLAWRDLDPATTPPQQLIHRARCVTVMLGVMMLASIFLIGRMLGDIRFAALATISVASTFFFQRQVRTASYDIHYVAWTTAAVALGLWAMNPLGSRPTTLRRIAGWGGCAIALCAAAMSKNPLPYLLALPPLIAAILMLSQRRMADAALLSAATLLSAAPVVAWYWHVFETYPRLAERALGREITQPRSDYQPLWYYLGVFGLVVPWTLWLIGALIEPFRMPAGWSRRVAMLALFWFGFILVGMSIPAAKQQRYVLGIVPAIGILLSCFIRRHDERAGRGEDDRMFRTLFGGTWIVLAIASIGGAWFLAAQQQYIELMTRWQSEADAVVVPLVMPAAFALAIALLAICVVGWRSHADRPWLSSMAMAMWMLLLMTVFWRQEAGAVSERVQQYVDEAARIRAIVGDSPLRSLRVTREDSQWQFNEEFRIYYGRLIERIHPDELDEWLAGRGNAAYIVARSTDRASEILRTHGFERVDQARIDRNELQDLWAWRLAATPTP